MKAGAGHASLPVQGICEGLVEVWLLGRETEGLEKHEWEHVTLHSRPGVGRFFFFFGKGPHK